MKKTVVLSLCSFATLLAVQTINAQTIADWTFETSQPGVVTLPAAPGAGVAFTSFSPEVGSGTATALHAGAATYSSPAGNGSAHSFSANTWATGDYSQFSVSTLNLQNINLSFDQTSSSTGPATFGLFYSVNGGSYTQVGVTQVGGNNVTYPGNYTVILNAAPNPTWNGTTGTNLYTFTSDLSSILAVNNDASVSFRLVDEAATGSTAGTDRVDNFIVNGSPVPEPATLTLAVLGGVACLVAFRRRR
jgi:hypothetical protein